METSNAVRSTIILKSGYMCAVYVTVMASSLVKGCIFIIILNVIFYFFNLSVKRFILLRGRKKERERD